MANITISNPHPHLIIFDIDSTLINPGYYDSHELIKKNLYDPQLLTPFFNNPKYQIAIASFNNSPQHQIYPIGGRRLGRAILDIQHPSGDSTGQVPDEFIQAWMFGNMKDMLQHGKNQHIVNISKAYYKKYGGWPPVLILYDDRLENVYLAGKCGVKAFWVNESTGLTRENIHGCPAIGSRIRFYTQPDCIFKKCSPDLLGSFKTYLKKYANTQHAYILYLPPKDSAKMALQHFLSTMKSVGLEIHIFDSDLVEKVVTAC